MKGGFQDLCHSLDFNLDSGNALSLVTLDADCLSADRSHVNSLVEDLLAHVVQSFAGDHVISLQRCAGRSNPATRSFWAAELAFGFLMSNVLVYSEPLGLMSLRLGS